MGQGPHVLHDVMLGTQNRADPVARVVDAKFHRHGPFQHCAYLLAQLPGGIRLHVPDRRENLQQVSARYLRDRHLPDARESVLSQDRHPCGGHVRIAPAGPLLFQHTRGGFGKGRYALGAALLRERVPTFTGELAVGQCLLPCLGQRDQGDAAQSELTAAAANNKPLDPAPGSGRLDEQVQAVAVGVSSRRGCAHGGGRQGLVRMAAFRFGFSGSVGCVVYSKYPLIIWGIAVDFKGRCEQVKSLLKACNINNIKLVIDLNGRR